MEKPIVVIGAGISGVMAARTLQEQGFENVQLLDKGRSVGGRMATRRLTKGKVDHGAQFFTVRSEIMKTHVKDWMMRGWIEEWFGEDHLRYKSVNGMNQLVKHLSADLATTLQKKVVHLTLNLNEDHYVLTYETGEEVEARGVVITAPAPQTVELVKDLPIEADVFSRLHKIQFHPCFVLLITLKNSSSIPYPGHQTIDLPDGIERIVDHEKKGISEHPTLSVYSTGAWAKAFFQDTDEVVIKELLQKINPIVAQESIEEIQLKRWRYSEAIQTIPSLYLSTNLPVPLLIAGDAFLGKDDIGNRARVESAVLSGIAAGEGLGKALLRLE